jgi:YVTN family beta-propeller protein
MKKTALIIGGVLLVLLFTYLIMRTPAFDRTASNESRPYSSDASKVYVAVEGDGEIAVVDPDEQRVIKRIDLSSKATGYMPHNVQVSPDGKTVWVTANAMSEADNDGGMMMKRMDAADAMDQVIVIDPEKDEIIRRIDMGSDLHLSHVALAPDSSFAIVASQEQGRIFKINANSYTIEREMKTPMNAGPHGLRIAPDGATAYIAMLSGKFLGILDLEAFALKEVPAGAAAVQTAVTPDGMYALVSLYESNTVGVYDPKSGTLSQIDLPTDAKGPVQLYPTPDSKFVYVADQGYYFDKPVGDKIYKIDVSSKRVVATIETGQAPHGVVVSKDGRYVYVTNLLSDDLSIIDTSKDEQIVRVSIGKQPNGVSVWSAAGGTP